MENVNSLNKTKKKLSLIFAWVVFCIAFFLEFTYLSARYYWSYKQENEDFKNISSVFSIQVINNWRILEFMMDTNRFIRWWEKPDEENRWKRKEDLWPLRFIDFITIWKDWEIINWSLRQDINIENFDFSNLDYNKIIRKNWLVITKVPVWIWDVADIVFLRKQMYSLWDYFEDLLYFNILNLLFWILFYYIWLAFVNKNLKPVEENIADMNDFIHNASHELKTPISVVSSNLQLLKELKSFEPDLILSSIDEIKRIDNLIVWLTNLSNISFAWNIEKLDVKKEIEDILSEFKNITEEKQIDIEFKAVKKVSIEANREYFYIMFSNLLRNAIKYNTKNNWYIKIELKKDSLSVANSSYWIENEDLDKIFDRFYKCEKSRNSEGFWIWLSLVKKICDIYKWKVSVNSELNKETKFEIKF